MPRSRCEGERAGRVGERCRVGVSRSEWGGGGGGWVRVSGVKGRRVQ